MSLKNKLNRLKPHLSGTGQTEKMIPIPDTKTVEIPFLNQWKENNVSAYFIDNDYCLIREARYPLTHRHGNYRFSDFLMAIKIWNQDSPDHPLSAKGFQAEELFFFDTETTGLGGGVGNTIFLLGYASVSGNELLLRQHILPNPGAEVPLYQSFLEKVNYKTLVTYNGKSFDWPQVKTRHTLVRDHVPNLPSFGHFDLYHAARRLWKHRLERLKLSIVEQEVLGVEREGDIPGYLAPIIYFDFIESNQPEGMLGILKHNEIDILSLVTLYTHLTFQLCGVDHYQTRLETLEVGRWYAALGQKKEAEKVLNKLTKGNDPVSIQAKLTLAYQLKRERNWEQVSKLFLEVADSGEGRQMLEACIELSKIYEHRKKNLILAVHYCEKAINLVSNRKEGKNFVGEDSMGQLLKRKKRLAYKLSKMG